MLSIPFKSRIKKNPILFGALLDFFVVVNFKSARAANWNESLRVS